MEVLPPATIRSTRSLLDPAAKRIFNDIQAKARQGLRGHLFEARTICELTPEAKKRLQLEVPLKEIPVPPTRCPKTVDIVCGPVRVELFHKDRDPFEFEGKPWKLGANGEILEVGRLEVRYSGGRDFVEDQVTVIFKVVQWKCAKKSFDQLNDALVLVLEGSDGLSESFLQHTVTRRWAGLLKGMFYENHPVHAYPPKVCVVLKRYLPDHCRSILLPLCRTLEERANFFAFFNIFSQDQVALLDPFPGRCMMKVPVDLARGKIKMIGKPYMEFEKVLSFPGEGNCPNFLA